MPEIIEKREVMALTDQEIEEIAERAAEKAVHKLQNEIYKSVGKSVLDKLYYVVGVLAIALAGYAASKGWIKP